MGLSALVVVGALIAAGLAGSGGAGGTALEVVATGIPRPTQLVVDGRSLVVLGPGLRGDAAGELYRIDLDGPLPTDAGERSTVRLGFAPARTAVLGSLALHAPTRQLFLGEENGARIYRLGAGGTLELYATGLHRLAGGSTLAFDAEGRLLVLDHFDRTLAPGEEAAPPGLEPTGEDDYRGPLLFRLAFDGRVPLPRRLDRTVPLFPRAASVRSPAFLPHYLALAPLPGDDVALLDATGSLFRLAPATGLERLARLPGGHGQYNRISMVADARGTVFVSGGFHVARVFRVSPAGAVETLARDLRDPEGVALDERGYLYVAESSRHRVVRLPIGLPR